MKKTNEIQLDSYGLRPNTSRAFATITEEALATESGFTIPRSAEEWAEKLGVTPLSFRQSLKTLRNYDLISFKEFQAEDKRWVLGYAPKTKNAQKRAEQVAADAVVLPETGAPKAGTRGKAVKANGKAKAGKAAKREPAFDECASE